MDVRDDAFLIAQKVRNTCERPPPGVAPWKGAKIHALLERCWLVTQDHQRFHLEFFDGLRDLLDDEDEDALLVRFSEQALRSEPRVLADSISTRDHLTHVTQVFLLGWLILNGCARFSILGDEWSPYGWRRDTRFRRLNRAWVYTALLHDCAYSVEYANLAAIHEQRVRSLFGAAYRRGIPGGIDLAEASRAGAAVWRRRAQTIDLPVTPQIRRVCETLEAYPDHAFYAAQALFAEAHGYGDDLRDLIEVAATSLLCHNFRHLLDPAKTPSPEVVAWFSLDFWQEPLAGLLTICDELEEWGRERVDIAMARLDDRKGAPFSQTILTHFEFDDADGLTLDVRLARSLLPEDRRNARRLRTERERGIADDNRTYLNGFKPRIARPDLHLHVRVIESVDGLPCRIERRVAWPASASGMLRQAHATLLAERESNPRVLQPVEVSWPASPSRASLQLSSDGESALSVEEMLPRALRLALVAPGGVGKSVLLRGLAGCSVIRGPGRQRRRVTALYVQELGESLTDLLQECKIARQGDDDLLLVLDHLDRLVETSVEAFWTDAIRALAAIEWIHLVVACRPEEFAAVIGHSLRGLFPAGTVADLPNAKGLLAGNTDDSGRITARTIGRHIVGDPDAITALGQVAVSMGKQRFLHRRLPDQASAVTFAGEPIARFDGHRVRFVHDSVQDYLAARFICHQLEAHHDSSAEAAASLKQLVELPRDVLRLLLEIVELERRKHSSHSTASIGLANGFLRAGGLRHWLTESARLEPTASALETLDDRFADHVLGVQTGALLALQRYARINLTDRHDEARWATEWECGTRFTGALVRLGRHWRGSQGERELCVALSDHLLTMLTRLAHRASGEAARLRARALDELPTAVSDIELAPSAIRGWVDVFSPEERSCTTIAAFDRELGAIVASERGHPGRHPLALRRCQLAGHIAGTWLADDHLDRDGFIEALRWQERAIARIASMLRNSAPTSEDTEQYYSRSQALAEIAWRRSCCVLLWARAWRHGWHPEAQHRLLEAHTAQAAGWHLAKRALTPGERLTTVYRQAMAILALGTSLSGRPGRSRAEVTASLDGALSDQNGEYVRLAEQHPRFDSLEWEGGFVERFLGEVHDFAAAFCG